MTPHRLQEIAVEAPIMLWRSNAAGACIFVNQRWCSFTGLTAEDCLGSGWLELIHPDDRQSAHDSFEADASAHRPVLASFRLRRADGVFRRVLDIANPVFDGEQRFDGYVGSVIDIDDIFEISASGVSAPEAQHIAREISQPISAINNFATSLLFGMAEEEAQSGEVRRLVEKIKSASERAGDLAKQLKKV